MLLDSVRISENLPCGFLGEKAELNFLGFQAIKAKRWTFDFETTCEQWPERLVCWSHQALQRITDGVC